MIQQVDVGCKEAESHLLRGKTSARISPRHCVIQKRSLLNQKKE